ncbi:ankyrin [Auriculariales sp. MPI-PUGE-AT-0066]|nr:ankyrin [Auriculariales sp. MPI-PUGE-AT-0066]
MSQTEFDAAATYMSTAPGASSAPTPLKLEAPATVAPKPTAKRPGMFDFAGRAKWDAWNGLAAAEPAEHRVRYIAIAKQLGWNGVVPESDSTAAAAAAAAVGISAPASSSKDSDDEPIDWSDDVPPPPARGGGMGAAVSVMVGDTADAVPHDLNTLHGCVHAGDINRLRGLLESGTVDVNSKDEYGFTPLHLAADRGLEPAARLLLDHKADPLVQDPDGETALSLATVSGYDSIVQLLQQRQVEA